MKSFLAWINWQRIPISQIKILRLKFETTFLVSYALFYIGFAFVTGQIIKTVPHPFMGADKFTHDICYIFVFKLLGLLIIPLVVFRKWGYRFHSLLISDWKPSLKRIVWSLVAFGSGLLINYGHLQRLQESDINLLSQQNVFLLFVAILLPLVTAGIPEELFFRKMLQTRIEAIAGRVAAILIASFLFMAWHIPTRYLLSDGIEGHASNLSSVLIGTGIPVFIMSLVFAWLWDRYRSLVPLIIFHWSIDIWPSISSFLSLRF